MTYSILGLDPLNGDLGIAVQSKFPNVGGLVPYGKAKVGVIATQAFGNPIHGSEGLMLLQSNIHPQKVISILLENDPSREQRQIGIINSSGEMASYTGEECLGWNGWAGSVYGKSCVCQGNGLESENVLREMVNSFQETSGSLAEKLIEALFAAQRAGGELRGQQSSGLLVVRENGGYGGMDDRYIDIRIYDHKEPINELARCFKIHKLTYFCSDPSNLIKIDADISKELKEIMTERGFYKQASSKEWAQEEIKALQRFMGWENYDNRMRNDDLIDIEVLDDIRKQHQVYRGKMQG